MTQNNLDSLIPDHISDIVSISLNTLDIVITVQAHSAADNWPKIRLIVNSDIVMDKQLIESISTIDYSTIANFDTAEIKLEYYGKTEKDTIISNNEIVENQRIEILKFELNGVDIVQNECIYNLGNYNKHLSPEKYQYCLEQGIDVGPSKSLAMFENGYWQLDVGIPILPWLTKLQSPYSTHERWPDQDLLTAIHNTIIEIRELESRLTK